MKNDFIKSSKFPRLEDKDNKLVRWHDCYAFKIMGFIVLLHEHMPNYYSLTLKNAYGIKIRTRGWYDSERLNVNDLVNFIAYANKFFKER